MESAIETVVSVDFHTSKVGPTDVELSKCMNIQDKGSIHFIDYVENTLWIFNSLTVENPKI